MSNTINKGTVYLFLDTKKSEVIKKEIVTLEEALEIEKEKVIEELTSKIDLEKLAKNTRNLTKDFEDIKGVISYAYGNLSNVTNYLNNLNEVEKIKNSIKHCITWKEFPNVVKASNKLDETREGIKIEYKKLNNMVKSCSTGNKAVRMLKEIGFDTSEIVNESPKNEVMVMNVNKKFLGI